MSDSLWPMDYSPTVSSVHETLQARILEWVGIHFSRGPSQCRDQTLVSYIFCIGRQVLVQFSSVQFLSHVRLCDPMHCSTPGFPVHRQLLELTQTHVHQVCDAIQPSHPQSSPSPPAFNISQHQGLFQMSQFFTSGGQIIGVSALASVLPMNIQDWFPLEGLVGSPCSPRDSQESSPTPQFKSINSLALSFLYSLTLTSIHDYWKNHSFD